MWFMDSILPTLTLTWIWKSSHILYTLQHVVELALSRKIESLEYAGVQLSISGRLFRFLEIYCVGGQNVISCCR